jgi:hypothetical protein
MSDSAFDVGVKLGFKSAQQKWISVKDWPVPDKDVLLYSEEEGCRVGDNTFDMVVTHWMELPELPNE